MMSTVTAISMINENFGDVGPITIDHQEILQLIPHRYPFLLVDRIEKVILNESAVGIKNVSYNEPFFQGHFPSHPIMPGVLIIEAMAQSAAALVIKTMIVEKKISLTDSPNDRLVYFLSIEEAKFRKPVFPGDRLELWIEKVKNRGNICKFSARAIVDHAVVAQALFTAMTVETVKK